MIPTLILLGLIFGRWWRLSLVAAAVGWPAALVVTDAMDLEVGLAGAALLAVANAGGGVAAHQAVLRSVRYLRDRKRPRTAVDA